MDDIRKLACEYAMKEFLSRSDTSDAIQRAREWELYLREAIPQDPHIDAILEADFAMEDPFSGINGNYAEEIEEKANKWIQEFKK